MAEEKPRTILQRVGSNPRSTPDVLEELANRLSPGARGFWILLAVLLPASAIVLGLLFTIPQFLFLLLSGANANAEALRNLSFVLAALMGFPFLIWRSWVAERQATTAEDNSITNSFSRAIEQLGATREVEAEGESGRKEHVPNIEVRLGALYTLERLMKASAKDHPAITDIIAAYVRENAPAIPDFVEHEEENANTTIAERIERLPAPREDIQTALTIICRSGLPSMNLDAPPIDWHLLNATCADLRNATRAKSILSNANMIGVNLMQANLQEAELQTADLRGANLLFADLRGADLLLASLQGADLQFADLRGSSLEGASLEGADLRGAVGLTQEQVDSALGDDETQLPEGLTRPEHW